MTTIAWTGETWNPIRACDRQTGKTGWFCVKVSPGCKGCYAEAMNRYRGNGHKYTVAGRLELDVAVDRKALLKPLSWKKGKKVFVCSMTDLFLDLHTDEMIDSVFAIMAQTPQHTYQVLTKRAKRMAEYSNAMVALSPEERTLRVVRAMYANHPAEDLVTTSKPTHVGALAWPLPNVWLGVSAEDQERFDERVPVLLQTPAAVRWVSYEPALERIDIIGKDNQGSAVHPYEQDAKLDWIVVGGESGRGARAFDPEWASAILSQCHGTSCRVFVKQMGTVIAKRDGYTDIKGEDPSEWPAELRVREYPEAR